MATTIFDHNPKGGRPPKFEPRFCQMLIDHMSQGLSYESFSAVVGTSRSTLYNWEKDFPEFLDAKKIGVECSQLFWEKIGLAQAVGDKDYGKGNCASWIFNMKNRFNWTDKQEVATPEDNRKQFKLSYSVDDVIDGELASKKLEPPKENNDSTD